MSIAGTAADLASINRFADTLKFSRYNTEDETDKVPFTSVVTSLNRSEQSSAYEITIEYEPELFDNTVDITMVVPENKVTTRSTLGKPDLSDNDLFESSDNEGEEQ
jgi:SUMO ligase MMS21 Smc5/6 complex component